MQINYVQCIHLTFDHTFAEWSAGCSSSPAWAWPWSPCPACGGRRGRAPRCPGPRRSGTPSHRCRTRSSFLARGVAIIADWSQQRQSQIHNTTTDGILHSSDLKEVLTWIIHHLFLTSFPSHMFGIEVQRVIVTAAGCRWRRCLGRWWRNRAVTVLCVLCIYWDEPSSCQLQPTLSTSSAATQLHHTAARTLETMTHSHQGNKTQPRLSFLVKQRFFFV